MSSLCLVNIPFSRSPFRPGPSVTHQHSVPAPLAGPGACGIVNDIDGMDEEMLPWKYKHTNMDGFLAPFFAPCSSFKEWIVNF